MIMIMKSTVSKGMWQSRHIDLRIKTKFIYNKTTNKQYIYMIYKTSPFNNLREKISIPIEIGIPIEDIGDIRDIISKDDLLFHANVFALGYDRIDIKNI